MKIVSLQSIGLGDAIEADAGPYAIPIPLTVEVGHAYPYSSQRSRVVSIHIGWDESERLNQSGFGTENPEYLVKTADGHIRVFPAKQYIAEWVEVDE